jgi:hypothetical protein
MKSSAVTSLSRPLALSAKKAEATEFFKDLTARIKNVTKESRAFEFLMQRLNVSMQHGNAVCVQFWIHYHQRRTWIIFLFLMQTEFYRLIP